MFFEIIGMIIIAYLLGSIPTGLWIGKYIYHKDIRKLGSGNIGTTNTFRTLGFKAGVVSIFDNFHGGKAVATSAGILLAYNPLLFVVACLIFIFVLCLTSMVSAASMVGISAIFIIALFIHAWILAIVAGILTGVVFYRHRSNIHRILSGKESMVSFGLGYYLREKKLNK